MPAGDMLIDDLSRGGFSIPELEEAGLEGWEVIGILPRRNKLLVGSLDDYFVGACFILKRGEPG